jgi:hypothetical protein
MKMPDRTDALFKRRGQALGELQPKCCTFQSSTQVLSYFTN